jgi:hemoglobin-like flavoprotein
MVYEFRLRPATGLSVWWSKSREEPGAQKQRHPINQDQIQIFGEIGSTQFLEQGLVPCSFLFGPSRSLIMSSANPIERSFELATAHCDDLTPLVYRRLFEAHPEAAAMFRTEGNELVKGSMLALTIEAILDFAGERRGNFRMIECEVASHDAYGTPRDLFVAFFTVIAGTLHEILGAEWTFEIDAAWQKLLRDIERIVMRDGG